MKFREQIVEREYDPGFDREYKMVNYVQIMVHLREERSNNWRKFLDILDDMERYFHAQGLMTMVSYSGGTMGKVVIYKNFSDLVCEDSIICNLERDFPEIKFIVEDLEGLTEDPSN